MNREIVRKIKHWFWWHFRATDNEKIYFQQIVYGTGLGKIIKGKRKFIDIKRVLKNL